MLHSIQGNHNLQQQIIHLEVECSLYLKRWKCYLLDLTILNFTHYTIVSIIKHKYGYYKVEENVLIEYFLCIRLVYKIIFIDYYKLHKNFMR